jgi:GNAT superfamily N-acetyltransferase
MFLAKNDSDILSAFLVMVELRPHLSESQYLEQVKLQMLEGYQLLIASDKDLVVGVAGFQVNRKLAFGRHIYVDDLVTINIKRSKGVGKAIVNWLIEYAETHECNEIHLDSGVQRFSAHRFYFREKFHICSYHFKVTLSNKG